MYTKNLRALTLLAAVSMAAAGCQGEKGPSGAPGVDGQPGQQGPKGDPGAASVVTGTLEGVASFLLNGNGAVTPASAVTVETLPPQLAADGVTVVKATTGADGSYSFANVPVGVYAVKFSGNAYTAATVDGVSVIAGKTARASKTLVATNPLTVASKVANQPFGFDAAVPLRVDISGGKGPYTVTWTPKAANATAAAVTGPAITPDSADPTKASATASITTGKFADILAGGKVIGLAGNVYAPNADPKLVVDRPGYVPVSVQQLAQMTYNVDVEVTDTATGWKKVTTVAVPTASLAQGSVGAATEKVAQGASVTLPTGTVVIAHFPAADDTTAATPAFPAGVTLNDAASKWPWFIATAKGEYSLGGFVAKDKLGARVSGVLPNVTVGDYVSTSFAPGTETNCKGCHSKNGGVPNADAKFKAWSNSAHGNHFFKFMEYDSSGNLAWKAGVTGLPTANPLMSWKPADMPKDSAGHPLPMTTWEFGMSGAEGAHYSSSCMGCHMTGYNAALASGGADDAIKAAAWTFNPATAFTGNLYTASATDTGEPVTKAPDLSLLTAAPASVKSFSGMQCESCHGPLGQHSNSSVIGGLAPLREFDVAACAVCHDRPTNHDRVALWRQSGHANLEVAVNEAGTDTHTGVASCARCHAAQGFVEYLSQRAGVCDFYKDVAGAAITDSAKFPPNEGPLFIRTTDSNGKVTCQMVDTNNTTSKAASDAYLAKLGLASRNVQPITCAACHDAHSTEVRVSGSTGVLPSGYRVNGAGSGALCMVCHNTRNGARGDDWGDATKGAPVQNGAAVKAIGGPHEANQTDVLVGANAYWVNGYRPGKHLSVAETCVGCHMKLHPDSVKATNTNHTFKADTTICKHCHGEEVNGEGLEGQYDVAVAAAKAAIMKQAQSKLTGVFGMKGTAPDSTKTARTFVLDTATNAVQVIDYVRGRAPAFTLKLATPVLDPTDNTLTTTTNEITIALGNFYGTKVDATTGNTVADTTKPVFDVLYGRIAKANWNFSLVQDGSKSFHNPSFVFEVLSVTKANVGDATKGNL
jgi:hypothetical protein